MFAEAKKKKRYKYLKTRPRKTCNRVEEHFQRKALHQLEQFVY